MPQIKYSLAFVSASPILQSGMTSIISERPEIKLIIFNNIQSFHEYLQVNDCTVAIIDSAIAVSVPSLINSIRKLNPEIEIILLIYQYINSSISNQYDKHLTIDEPVAEMLDIIQTALEKEKGQLSNEKSETLSDREAEVLRLLVTGYSAKEIADRLFISVNTVISHRKNISNKTGIKSLAGLAIYAVTRKIISMNSIKAN